MVDDAPTDRPVVQQLLAANLRRLRIARQLSLSELARATAISKATLSSIENGNSNPTVDTLDALAGALRVGLAELLEAPPLPRFRLQRAAQARRGPKGAAFTRPLERFVASAPGESLTLSELALAPGERQEHQPRPPGTRLGLYVIDGSLVAGPDERRTELGAGDYLTFDADSPYVLETARRPARFLLAEVTS
jgi:transcriptional regulator with XRE-family HTH domain